MRPDGRAVLREIQAPLPVARAHVRPQPADARRADPLELAGQRVLVVEDEALIAMEVEAALMDAGCEVLGPAGDRNAIHGLPA